MAPGDKLLPMMFGKVTHIIDPSDFWMQISTEADPADFKDYEQQLCHVAQSLPVGDVNKIEEGTVVLVCWSRSSSRSAMQWKRAKVLRIDREGNTFDVLYTDYGKTEIVPARHVRWNVPAEIQDFHCDCYRCALAGIQPIARSWTTRGIKTFKELVHLKTLKVSLVVFDHGPLKHRVSLYPCDEPSRSVTHEMLDKETGLPKDEGVKEYLKDVTLSSLEQVYGVEDYREEQEEASGNSNTGDSVTEETEDSSQSWATPSESYNNRSWATSSESSSTFPPNQLEVTSQSVDRGCFSEIQMVPDTTDQMGRYQGMGEEAVSNRPEETVGNRPEEAVGNRPLKSGWEGRTEASADSSAVVVPGFNLSGLQQRRMPSAQELQREQDEMQKALRRARLQRDMIECQRDMDSMKMGAEHGQKWGNSDLLLLYGGQSTVPAISRSPQKQGATAGAPGMEGDKRSDDGAYNCVDFDSSAEVTMMSLYPEDKGLKQHQDYTPENVSKLSTKSLAKDVEDVSNHEEKGEVAPPGDVPPAGRSVGKEAFYSTEDQESRSEGKEAFPSPEDQERRSEGKEAFPSPEDQERRSEGKEAFLGQEDQDGDDVLCEPPGTDGDEPQWALPPPPELHPSWTVEEKEYRIHKYIAQVLKEATWMDVETDSVCAAIYCLAALDAEQCEAEMKMVLEALLEEAVRSQEVRDLALEVFHSYSSVLKGELLLHILKRGAEKFIKLSVGKMQAHCTGFVDVMVQLLCEELDWPVLLKTVIQDFTLSCLEKWIIFNKRGTQTSLLHRQLEEMYINCVELLLPVSITKVQECDQEQVTFIFDQMREKVLETDVDYSVRSHLLSLLLKYSAPDFTNPAGETESLAKKSIHDQAVQVDEPPPLSPPSPPPVLEASGGQCRAVTMERGCQTDDLEKEGDRSPSCDASMQTDTWEGISTPRKTSVCSVDSCVGPADVLESAVSVPGRARRRRALLEHLSRQKQGGREGDAPQADSASSSCTTSPDCDPLFTSAAQLYSQPSIKTAASGPESAKVESGAAAGMETVAEASSVQSISKSVAKESESVEITCQTVQSDLRVGEDEKAEESQLFSQDVCAENGEDDSSEKSRKLSATSFISAMSSVSRAAFSAVFGNGKDDGDNSEATFPAAVSNSLEWGEDAEPQYVADLSSVDAMPSEHNPPSKEDDSSVCMLDDGQMGGTRFAIGTEKYFDGMRIKGDEASPNRTSYDDAFSRHPRGGFSVKGSSSDIRSSDVSTGQRTAHDVSYVNPLLTGRSAAKGEEDFDEDEAKWDDDFDFSQYAYRDSQRESFANQGMPDVGFHGDRRKGYGDKKMFSSEDFPPLPAQPVHLGSESSTRSQLTLDTIAVGLLESPEKHIEENQVPDSYTKVKESSSSGALNRSGERAAPGFSQSEIYISEDDDKGSVPSDWEDRILPSSSASSDCLVSGGGDAAKTGGGDGYTGQDDQGVWLKEKSAAGKKHKMDPAGDNFATQSSHVSSPYQVTEGNTSPAGARRPDVGDPGHGLSPAGSEDSFSQGSKSSSSTPPMNKSPGSAVPYQRGDLASMFDGRYPAKSKGRKKKFRPFDALQPAVQRASAPSDEKWDPARVICTNCDEVGHVRSDCLKPIKSLLF